MIRIVAARETLDNLMSLRLLFGTVLNLSPPGFAFGSHRLQIVLVKIQAKTRERGDFHATVPDLRDIAGRFLHLVSVARAFHHGAIENCRRPLL